MTTLPDIPRLYTALAEVLAALLYARRLPPRLDQRVIWGVEAGWAVLLGAFLQATPTAGIPLEWWLPCMAAAILSMLLFLWVTRSITLLEAGYVCARAFILAELAASVEWQLHCVLWPQRGGAEPRSLLLLAVVYGGIFTAMLFVENRRPGPAGKLKITPAGTFVAVVMALTACAVSNLSFAIGSEANMYMFYIRTLVDLAGALILTVQHEQLREAALHSELAELDGGKCILQLRGVRPFLSDKYDLTQHPNYKLTSDYDPKNTFDIEKYLNRKEKIQPGDEFIVVDADSLPSA